MKKLLLTVVLLSIYLSAQSQNNVFIYNRDEKVYLEPIANKFLVEFTDNEDKTILENNNLTHTKVSKKIYEVEGDLLQIQNAGQGIYNVNQLYATEGETEPIHMRNAIVLRWKDEITESEKNNLINQFGLIPERTSLLFSTYKTNNPIPLSQMVYETGSVEYCHPSFLVEVRLNQISNDTYSDQQFYLHNTEQILNEGKQGTDDADIDAPEAWSITTGNNIIVAVIDDGVPSNHPDIPNSRLLIRDNSDFFNWPNSTDDDPSPESGDRHGTAVAGIIVAEMNNNEGVVGVAPSCTIMPVRVNFTESADYCSYAEAIEFAVTEGSQVINCSWGITLGVTPMITTCINDALQYAMDNGVTVVFAAGNSADHPEGSGTIAYPARMNRFFSNVICVGASDRDDLQANYSPNGSSTAFIDIVAPSHTAQNDNISGEAENVWTTDVNDGGYNPYPFQDQTMTPLPMMGETLPMENSAYTGRFGGTSATAPQVARVIALMLSVNPCLTPKQIREILRVSTDKVGGYNYNWPTNDNDVEWDIEMQGFSRELGYGRLNAHTSVKNAQDMYIDGLDIFTKDVPEDLGIEPDEVAENLWESDDIWVRVFIPDGTTNQEHENPQYGMENFVYVKVRNKGCSSTSGNEEVRLYWAKASTALTWPDYWNGTIINPLMGDLIGTVVLDTPIMPGEEKIAFFHWQNIPNPADYAHINEGAQHHFCLLSRIVTPSDPMTNETVSIPWNLGPNVRENNNIAWKNISVLEMQQGGVVGGNWEDDQLVGATVHIGNATDEVNTFDIAFGPPKSYSGNSVFDEAEITVSFDETTWNKWLAGGKQKENIQISKQHRRQVIIKGKNAKLKNLKFDPHERGLMNVSFSFLTKRLSSKKEFKYHVKQSISSTGEVVGGETYHIKLPTRPTFSANAGGDIQISPNSNIELNASSIYEDAIYNWYGPDGTLIQTGRDISVPTDSTRKYKLEVIATSDGFKDYDEIEVRVKPAEIISITPNPASNISIIEYDAQQVNSAYLMVSMPFSTSTDIFPLDIIQTTYNLNVSQYQTGVYGILLVVDGQIVDQKGLIID